MRRATMVGFLGAVALVGAAAGAANNAALDQPVTFTKDVLPILQENCQACHRPNGANLGGMVAPMSFVTYDDTAALGEVDRQAGRRSHHAAVARIAAVPRRVRQRAHARR